ncbi:MULTISPECIES: YrzI family small protein [Heyndrickxia]|nr:YrzI family small protein [Heyndrickxia sporothermodurans]
MTLNLIFITVTIKKRTKTIEECMNEERINKIIEQYKMKHNEIFTRVL